MNKSFSKFVNERIKCLDVNKGFNYNGDLNSNLLFLDKLKNLLRTKCSDLSSLLECIELEIGNFCKVYKSSPAITECNRTICLELQELRKIIIYEMAYTCFKKQKGLK